MYHFERLAICKFCSNRAFDSNRQMVCGLTNKPANFKHTCTDFIEDEAVSRKIEQRKNKYQEEKKYIGKAKIIVGVILIAFGGVIYAVIPDAEIYELPLFIGCAFILYGVFQKPRSPKESA